jgi:hypothetical protein
MEVTGKNNQIMAINELKNTFMAYPLCSNITTNRTPSLPSLHYIINEQPLTARSSKTEENAFTQVWLNLYK